MKQHKYKVSVIISVYNQLHCLEKALQSALDQDYENIEIIIADDQSSDGDVKSFVNNFGAKVSYFRNKENLGANGNYRTALSEYATGDYAVVLNADDYWIDNCYISKAIEIMTSHPQVVLVFGDVKVYLANKDTFIEDKMNKGLPSIVQGKDFFIDFPKGYSLPHLTCLYKRELALDLNFYKNDHVSSDWESLLRMTLHGQIGYINSAVGVLTRHNDNYTKETNLASLKHADAYLHNLKTYAESLNLFSQKELDQWLDQMLFRHHNKWLIKLHFLNPNLIKAYEDYLYKDYPRLHQRIVKHFKYKSFKVLKKSPALLKWIFRNVLRQESFISDLLSFQKSKDGV